MYHIFSIWLLATRPQFFTVIILPILLGTVIAWHSHQLFSFWYLGLSLSAGTLAHAGVNVLNDYFDHLNHTDDYNLTPLTPFAGGSRFIQRGILSSRQTYYYGWSLLLVAVIIGLTLVWLRGSPLFWLGLLGIGSGYAYSAPPFSFNSRGVGEILVGFNFGLLAVIGAYYVQTQTITLLPIIAALPLTCLVTAILYLNEFPDYLADKQAHKNTLVVRLGLLRARHGYALLIGLNIISVPLGTWFNYLPTWSLLTVLTLPLGITAIKTVYANYDSPSRLIPAIKSTILLHTLTSLLLIVTFL